MVMVVANETTVVIVTIVVMVTVSFVATVFPMVMVA